MKQYNMRWIVGLLSIMLIFSLPACEEEKSYGPFETVSIQALITEAEALIAAAHEGLTPGDHKPGSKAELEEVITWVNWKLDRAENQDQVADAAIKLQKYIDIFKTNIVTLAIPWIKQAPDTHIRVSDGIKTTLDGAFTIEVECYIIDLNQLGWCNNLFSCEQGGPDSGFAVRYFGDGKIQVVVGNSGWVDTGDQAGPGTLVAGKWIHVALTNTGKHQILYIDGVKVASQDQTHLLASKKPFVIGNSPMWTDRAVNSMVRDVRVWSKVRTEQEIKDNIDTEIVGTEVGLELFLPLQADLGSKFPDATNTYTAYIEGEVEWLKDGTPPAIVLDYSVLNAVIADAEELKTSVTEGVADGDFPEGTKDFLTELIDGGNAAKIDAARQDQVDKAASEVKAKLKMVRKMLVADSDGVFIDRNNENAVAFRITPNYTPQGDYTVEFYTKIKTFNGYEEADLFNNGEYRIRVTGYNEPIEDKILAAGSLLNYTNDGNENETLKTESQVIKKDRWQHVAIVHDNTARTTILYVDGVQKAIQNNIGAPVESGWGEMWLGHGWYQMNGYIKDFRLWNVARNAADLDADINGTEAGLHAYFPLNKVKGVKFDDVTGNFRGEMRGIEWNSAN